jgi:hypothetical protein
MHSPTTGRATAFSSDISLQQQRQTGSSFSIVLPFISVFTVSMSFSSLMVLGFLRVSDRRTALAAATI